MAEPTASGPGGVRISTGDVLLGRFRIERTLGRGGMGEVFLAFDELLDRAVALKRVRAGSGDEGHYRETLLREARRASRINDRRIAAIYDVVEHAGDVILVMEYVDGVTLRQRMADTISLDTFWDLAIQCAEAIVVAHKHGVIHRDVKPENLMVTEDGEVKVLDFGIAKRTQADPGSRATASDIATGHVAGTPHYMAPEVLLGQPIDARTDIFSLGVVFYEMLAREQPFPGSTHAAVTDRILNVRPTPVHEHNPAVGRALSALVQRMLERKPDDRFTSATDVLHHMRAARQDGAPAVATLPTVPAARAPGMARRRRRIWAYAAAAVVVAAGALALVRWRAAALPKLPDDVNLALLRPQTLPADEDFAFFALGATEHLGTRLRRLTLTPGFQMAAFDEAYDEKVRTASDARAVLGATVALVPTFEALPNVLRARFDLYETERAQRIASRSVETPVAQPFAFLDQAYRECARMLGLVPDTLSAQTAQGIRGPGTLRFYLEGRGRAQAATSEPERRAAIEAFELAARTGPDEGVVQAGLAGALYSAASNPDNPDLMAQAEVTARKAVRLAPDRPEGHRILGFVLRTERKTAEAAVSLERACALDPTDRIVLTLARTYRRLGNRDTEVETYRAAIQRRPHCWQPYWWLAIQLYSEGQFDAAIDAYENMVQRAPQLYRGYSDLGGLLVLRAEYDRAIETLEHSNALRPTNLAFQNLGTAFFNTRRFEAAVAAYNQSFQFGFADATQWLNLGEAYYWLGGNEPQAVEAYKQGIQLGRAEHEDRVRNGRPIEPTTLASMASTLQRIGEPDSAQKYLDLALANAGDNPHVQYHAALVHWQRSEPDTAMAWLEKSVRGGYPAVWLRDSIVFDEWRALPAFRDLVRASNPDSVKTPGTG